MTWQAPSEPVTNSDELQIAGIYIRLLNQNPMWTLRRPREFITCLFDRILDLVSIENPDSDELTLLAEAGCNLLTAQTNLTKMGRILLESILSAYLTYLVPGMGIMPTLIDKLSKTKTLRPILLILHALCQEAMCVSALAQIPNSILALKVRITVALSISNLSSEVSKRGFDMRNCCRGTL